MTRLTIATAFLGIMLSGCSLTGVDEDGAAARVRVETERQAYAPLDLVRVTVTNRGDEAVYLDVCSGGIEGFYDAVGDWNGSYGMARICAPFATREDVVEHMRRIEPSRSVVDTLHVNAYAYEGRWRVYYNVLDSEGGRLPDGRVTSNEFGVVLD